MEDEAKVIGLATYESEKYLTTQRLIAAAHEAGLKINDELLRQIDEEASAYASVTARLEDLQEAQLRADEMHSTFRSAFSGFAQDIRQGEGALHALGNALDRIADKLMDMATNNLFDAAFGKSGTSSPLFGAISGASGGGLLGGILLPGILHKGGIAGNDNVPTRAVPASAFAHAQRYHNGGIAGLKPNEVLAILERGEQVIPKNQAQSGGGTVVNITNHNDFRGVDPSMRAWIEGRLEVNKQQAVQESVSAVAKTRSLNPRYGAGVF